MNRVFVDMDGVIVDFEAYKTASGLTANEIKRQQGAYLAMPPMAGAIEAVREVSGMGYEVWVATKPPTGVPHAYSDKAAWVFDHLPELERRLIITHDKGLLGDAGDYLCDDRPHKANCANFPGTLLAFVDGYHWPQALAVLRKRCRNGKPALSRCGILPALSLSSGCRSQERKRRLPAYEHPPYALYRHASVKLDTRASQIKGFHAFAGGEHKDEASTPKQQGRFRPLRAQKPSAALSPP